MCKLWIVSQLNQIFKNGKTLKTLNKTSYNKDTSNNKDTKTTKAESKTYLQRGVSLQHRDINEQQRDTEKHQLNFKH